MRLESRDLRSGYGPRDVLLGVSVTVEPGSVTVILGANGAGKSTLLKSLIGQVRVSSGGVWYAGEDITNKPIPSNVRRGLALVPETGGVFRDFTVRENLQLGAYTVASASVIAERVEHVFSVFPKLADRAAQKAGTLSGGERQMLAIGRALMAGPRFMMLDEPFLGLAPSIIDVVVDSLSQINKVDGVSLLIVEQNVRILDIASRAYVLRLGEIVIDESDPSSLVGDDGRLEASFMS
jgi:branched-chain amino acid transport system ATP-binding protein